MSKFLEIMMISVTKLTYLSLSHMKEKNYGRIINLSSISAYIPEDKGNLYAAVKKYVLSFSKSISKEFEGTGIQVLALCPGLTRTSFHENFNQEELGKFPNFMWMSSERVAEEAYRSVENNKRVHIPGLINKLICFFCKVLPYHLLDFFSPKDLIEESYNDNFKKA